MIENTNANYVQNMIDALNKLNLNQVQTVTADILSAYESNKHVFVIGNGGSAALASHMACDLAKTTLAKSHGLISKRIRAIALSDNVPAITAWGNDYSYEFVYSEQLRTLADPGDLLIAISSSGNSPNIIKSLEIAKEMSIRTIGIFGFGGGKGKEMVDSYIVINSNDYGVVEDMHSIVNHMLTAQLKQHVLSQLK